MGKIGSRREMVSFGLCVVLFWSSHGVAAWTRTWDWGIGSKTVTQPESAPPLDWGGAITSGIKGNAFANLIAYPNKCPDGADECSTSLDNSWQMYTRTWSGCNLTYTTWPFEVEFDTTWTVGGNSNNGRLSAATTTGSGELSVTVDAEPDDSDVSPGTRTSRWDGSKTEQCPINGLGIYIWGVSLSWNAIGDIWEDANQGSDPTTTVWQGTLDNETDGGSLVTTVSLKVNTDLDCSVTGNTWAERAGMVDVTGDVTTFSF